MPKAINWLLTAGILIGGNSCAWAQGFDAPKVEYLSHCASCHGDSAKGDGPRAAKLSTRPTDLTILSKKNRGVFPLSAVYAAIDGRNTNSSNGAHDMPIWGCRSSPRPVLPGKTGRPKSSKPDPYDSHLDLACDPEDIISNRILTIIEYLRRVQEP
jgi:hypothetical protein